MHPIVSMTHSSVCAILNSERNHARNLATAGLIWIVLGANAPAEENHAGRLFTEIKMLETVVNAPSVDDFETADETLLGVTSLSSWLIRHGIKGRTEDETVVADINPLLPQGSQAKNSAALSVRLSVDADRGILKMELPLALESNSESLNTSDLVDAMRRASTVPHVFVAIDDRSPKLITSIGSGRVTIDALRSSAKQLVRLRVAIQSNVSPSDTTATNKTTSATQTSGVSRSVPSNGPASVEGASDNADSAVSIAGTWSATTSAGDAWAIRFTEPRTFVMVHTRKGSNTVSRGNYSLQGKRLSLKDNAGVTLSGDVREVDAASIEWTLLSASGEQLMTLKLNKR